MIQYYYGGSRVVLMAITVHLLDRGKRLMLEQRTPIEASMPPIISEGHADRLQGTAFQH